ncbi:MAG TPA: hypothetical protein VIL74_06970 [Pyrinomonadaceae bacterium]|jgi:hypothetical protein
MENRLIVDEVMILIKEKSRQKALIRIYFQAAPQKRNLRNNKTANDKVTGKTEEKIRAGIIEGKIMKKGS